MANKDIEEMADLKVELEGQYQPSGWMLDNVFKKASLGGVAT